MLNWNTEPYNDDFDEKNKFHRILFRPGYAVQARELTQIQSILQNQIKRNGDHIFKHGAMVIPGQISLDRQYRYVKIQPTYGALEVSSYISNFEGVKVTGAISGVSAKVVLVEQSTASDPITIYVKYIDSGTDGVTKTFIESEELTTEASGTVITFATTATGIGSAASIERGVYYINGNYVLCDAQTLLLDKYTNTPSYRVGLTIDEQTITPEDNESLLDNAQTSFNYAAPGAHRYSIDLILSKLLITDAVDDNFVELLRTTLGVVNTRINYTAYAELEKTLARRTYDESGNYTVSEFAIDVREHRTNDRGQWVMSTPYIIGDIVTNGGNTYVANISKTSGSIAPTHLSESQYDGSGYTGVHWSYNENPTYNRGVYLDGSVDKLAIGLEPGKAYIQGYEVEKVAKEYVEINKARDSVQVDNAIIPATVGNYVLVNNLNNLPRFDTFETVDLYDRITNASVVSLVGTLAFSSVSASVTGTTTAFTTELTVGSNLYLASSGVYLGTILSIASDTALTLTANATATVSPAAACKRDGRGTAVGTKIGTCRVRGIEWDNGTIGATTAIYKLFIFDTIMVAGYDFNRDVKSFYYSGGSAALSFTADISPITTQLIGTYTFSTTTITGQGTSFQTDLSVGDYIYLGLELRRVVTLTAQQTLTVDTAPTATGLTIKLVKTAVYEPQNSGLIFPFPYYAIKSARSSTKTNDTSYTITERFTKTTSGDASITLDTNSGTFASAAETDNYLCVNNATGAVVLPTSIAPAGSSVIIQFASPTFNSTSFTISATVNKTGADLTEKTKTTASATITFDTAADATKKILLLGKADLVKISSIKMKSGDFVTPGATYSIDISDRFTVDSGRRDSYYDVARLNLIPSFNAPEAPIEVKFVYFLHGSGDYFTVNSYPENIKYEDIVPTARDGIDFRPRISDAGDSFVGGGAVTSGMPKRGVDIRSDFTYYIARKDKIVLNSAGDFLGVAGNPGLNPGLPEDPSLSMLLYTLSLEPYTFSTSINSVQTSKIDNRRYTMRDIGALEKRIDNIEYYTSLSLLEQQVESLEITDDVGLNRFKNGFIVDSFSGHGIGDTASLDYLCSIDVDNSELRPFFSIDNVNLIEKNGTDGERNGDNYKLYGDVITLPIIEHVKLVEQKYASRLETVNPFAVVTFLGDVTIFPSSDDWFDPDTDPDIVDPDPSTDVDPTPVVLPKKRHKHHRDHPLGHIWPSWKKHWAGHDIHEHNHKNKHKHEHIERLKDGDEEIKTPNRDRDEVTAHKHGKSRDNIKHSVISNIHTKIIKDRVVSTAVIPYIRSRRVLIQARGLKPNTKFYPFFDGVDIAADVTPSTKLEYEYDVSNPTGFVFDSEKNVGGHSSHKSRRIDGDPQVGLNKGDVVFVASRGGNNYTIDDSPATSVVIGKDNDGAVDNYGVKTKRLHLTNTRGTFQIDDIIQGSISGCRGKVKKAHAHPLKGDAVHTNHRGEINLLFHIPHNHAHKFRCGSKELKLVDVDTSDEKHPHKKHTSKARCRYIAGGVVDTDQGSVTGTRDVEVVTEQVTETQTIVQTVAQTASRAAAGWYDPLAQTFLIDSAGGAFVTKIDVFFASKDTEVPVSIELREVENGFPGKRVLPFSRVSLNPEDVAISAKEILILNSATGLDDVVGKYDTATTFTFPSPVFVKDKTEYCLVILSDSGNYKVWISNIGDIIPDDPTTMISEQPYNGILFKPQNVSTWAANRDQDLKFTIWRAKFNTAVIGNVEFVNDLLPYDTLSSNPIEVKAGENIVRVWHANHAMPASSSVDLTDLTNENIAGVIGAGTITCGTGSPAVTGSITPGDSTVFSTSIGTGTVLYNAAGTLIGVVASVTNDTTLVLVDNAAVAVAAGAYYIAAPIAGIPVTEIYKSHVIDNVDLDSYTITTITSANTSGYFGGTTIRATKNVQYDTFHPIIQSNLFTDTTVNYSIKMISGKSADGTQTPYTEGTRVNCSANATNTIYAPSLVASKINEDASNGGNKSISFIAQISSTNDALSPIIDTHRLSLITVSNKIDSPTEVNMNVAVLDTSTLFTGAIGAFSFSGSTITSTAPAVRDLIKTIQVGKYITVSAATTAGNNGTYLVTGNVDNGTSGTITVSNKTFTNEAAVTATKIETRKMFVDEIAPVGSSTRSKYVSKIINLENQSTYIRVRMAAYIPDEADVLVYYKAIAVGSTHNTDTINWTLFNPDKNLIKVQNGSGKFTDVDYSIVGLAPFDAIQIKVVMKSTNSSAVPRIKDLRIIVCA